MINTCLVLVETLDRKRPHGRTRCKNKEDLSQYLIKHDGMKTYGAREVQLLAFLISALDGTE
jgi:hypothetical protein